MKAIIVGAGIGGLTAAIDFALRGWQPVVLERAKEISEIGAGIQLSPNAMHVLNKLGITTHLAETATYPDVLEMRNGRTGKLRFSIPIAQIASARYGADYIHIHRADLIDALLARLSAIAPDAVQTDCSVSHFEQTADGITAITTTNQNFSGDILVGCDGVRSVVREQMFGADAPEFTGFSAWRTTIEAQKLGADQPPQGACIWTGANQHAVTTRIRAGKFINFVGIISQSDWREEGWSIKGDINEARRDFKDWASPIEQILQQSTSICKWALLDRAPLKQWSVGRAVLLGDACHPMLPSMAQGGAQAIEDAYVLGQMLAKHGDHTSAFDAYFKTRIGRTTGIKKLSRSNIDTFHGHGIGGAIKTHIPIALVSRIAPSFLYKRQDWIWGHDVTN